MDQHNVKKEDAVAPSTAAFPNAAVSRPLPVATPAAAISAGTTTTAADTNKRPAALATAAPVAKKPNTAPATYPNQKSQLQQQIQQQLQQQLQAQLQAAAARGQQANITPEQIQVRIYDHHLSSNSSSFHALFLPRPQNMWTIKTGKQKKICWLKV